jgi:Asp-tRNA(Asn)/Glu-tRNA(Gln) amidotransferase A subunit family amidase
VDFLKIQRHRQILMRKMADVMENVDLYVCNTDLGDCTLCSMTGHPAVIVPWTFASVRNQPEQPQCTALVGRLFGDDLLLSVAHAFQSKTDFHARRPKIEA